MGTAADPVFAREQTMVSAQSASLNRRLGAASGGGAPSGVLGQSTWWGSRRKSFLSFSYKKWPKVKDLIEKFVSPVSRSHDQP